MTRREGAPSLAATPESGWDFAPFALMRTAGLPAAVGDRLRFPRTMRLLERFEELQVWLLAERELLSELLHGEVHRLREDASSRRVAINLRRDLYQLKAPSARVREELEKLLAPEVVARVKAFLAAMEEQRTLREAFSGTLESEYLEKRSQLQSLVREHPQFHTALDVASASLSQHLTHYLKVGPEAPSASWRSLEASLVSYFMRASIKTSPLSRFAWVSALAWPPREEGPVFQAELDPRSFRSKVELNRSVLRLLLVRLLAHPEVSLHLKYRLNPDLVIEGEYAYVFSRTWGEQLTERYGRLRLGGAHRALLAYVERQGALSLVRLAGALGDNVSQEQGLALLRKLVDSGLLVSRLLPGDDEPDALGHVIRELRETELPLAHTWAGKLEEVRELVARYAVGEGSERVACRTRIQGLLGQVLTEVSPDAPPPLPERLIYENAVATAQQVRAPRELTRPEASEAGLIAGLLSLLDDSALSRLRDVEAFVRRYGVGGVCQNLNEFFLPPQAGASELPAPEPRTLSYLEQLKARREQLKAASRAFFSQLFERVRGREGQEEVSLEPEWVRAMSSAEPVRHTRAVTLLLQASPRHDAYVLNVIFPGYGALLSRFAPLLRQEPGDAAVVEALQERLKRLSEPGRPAQVVLSSGHSVNAFPTLTDEALLSAGAPPSPSQGPEVRLRELTLRHVPERNELELVHTDGGVRVPLYLGLLSTAFLPPIDQKVIRLAPGGLYRPAFVDAMEQLAGPATGTVRVWPRLRLGKFILSRRTWVVSSREEVERRKGEGDFDYWVRLRRWADSHQLPRRFFLYPPPDRYLLLGQQAMEEGQRGWLKPQLIDLDSAFSLQTWEKQCRGMALPWHLQEVLPEPEEATVTVEGRSHVAELGVELHQRQET